MDRWLSLLLYTLALICLGLAALLALAGFLDFLILERWPDQSLLRVGYDSGLLRPRWFLAHDWAMAARNLLARVPAALALLAVAPLCWWLGGRLAAR